MASQIRLRRGTAAQWTSANPTLASGEAGFETDTNQLKIGNGTDNWTTLDYISSDLTPYATLASPTFTGTVEVDGNLEVAGSLNVSGSVTTISSQDLVLEDSLIYLAEGNTGNIVDIGIVGSFTQDSNYQHAGLVRDASDGVWKLFESVEDEPTTSINFAQALYSPLKAGSLEVTSATIGDVSNTEIQYLNNASANIQEQLNTLNDASAKKEVTIVAEKTGAYTLQNGDQGKMIELNGTFTVSIPTDATYNFAIGTQITVLNVGTGQITIAAVTPGTTVVNGTPGLKLRTQWSSATLIKRKSDSWVVIGDLIA